MFIRLTLLCIILSNSILGKKLKIKSETFEKFSYKGEKRILGFLCIGLPNMSVPIVYQPDIKHMSFLYMNSKFSIKVPLLDANNLWNNTIFRQKNKLVLLVTGWKTNVTTSETKNLMFKAFMTRPDVNFVVVDVAHYLSMKYIWSALNTDLIGKHIAEGLKNLVQINKCVHIHLIGHSLGAHVVGSAGRTFHKLTGRRVSRITGLDPAFPCFQNNLPRLGIGDAEIVDIIHTNNDFLGIRDAIGDVDFYPAGGRTLMPGCVDSICSHSRAVEYFAESVNPKYEDSFPVRFCSSMQDLLHRDCDKTRHVMGYVMDLSIAKGIYDVKVNKESPFGKGQIRRHGKRIHKKAVRGVKKHKKLRKAKKNIKSL